LKAVELEGLNIYLFYSICWW